MNSDDGCLYPADDPLFRRYHDEEWGRPVSDDTRIFEKICLEGFQSGLSWKTILHRRDHFREQFDHFNIAKISDYKDLDISNALANPNIIRNKRKIRSVVNNAKRAIELKAEFGSLGHFLWQFEPENDQRPASVTRSWLADNTTSKESVKLSHELKRRGWTFIGPTNMYALMQALGLVNDHTDNCPNREAAEKARSSFTRP